MTHIVCNVATRPSPRSSMGVHEWNASPEAAALLPAVERIVPLIAEHAARAEELRRPADEVIEALKQTGIFRAFVPREFGGLEIDLDLFVSIGIAVSEACPSTGWITTFYMEHNWLLARFPEQLRQEVFGSQPYVLAPGSVNPSGRAVVRGDHYELSGHWQFGTGVTHADWVLLSGMLDDEEKSPFPRLFMAPIDEVEVKDTWHVDGMSATGSRDIIADAIEIPEYRVSLPQHVLDDPDRPRGYLERIPLRPMLSLTAAIPAVGCARRAVALFREHASQRTMFGTTKLQTEFAATHIRLGRLATRTKMAEMLMRSVADELTRAGRGELDVGPSEVALLRTEVAEIVRMCRDIVRDVMEGSGAKAHFLDNELQRIHRDVHVIASHTVFDVDLVAADAGRTLLPRQS